MPRRVGRPVRQPVAERPDGSRQHVLEGRHSDGRREASPAVAPGHGERHRGRDPEVQLWQHDYALRERCPPKRVQVPGRQTGRHHGCFNAFPVRCFLQQRTTDNMPY